MQQNKSKSQLELFSLLEGNFNYFTVLIIFMNIILMIKILLDRDGT